MIPVSPLTQQISKRIDLRPSLSPDPGIKFSSLFWDWNEISQVPPVTVGYMHSPVWRRFQKISRPARILKFDPWSICILSNPNFVLSSLLLYLRVEKPLEISRLSIILYVFVTFFCLNRLIGLVVRVFGNGPVDRHSIPGWVIPNGKKKKKKKKKKRVLDATLLNTQHYKVHIKGKVERSRERSSALPYTSV